MLTKSISYYIDKSDKIKQQLKDIKDSLSNDNMQVHYYYLRECEYKLLKIFCGGIDITKGSNFYKMIKKLNDNKIEYNYGANSGTRIAIVSVDFKKIEMLIGIKLSDL